MYGNEQDTGRVAEEPRFQVVQGGQAQGQQAPPRQLAKRIVTIPLKGDYEGFSVTAWVNFPNTMLNEMNRLAREYRRDQRAKRQRMEDDFWAEDDDADDDTMANSPIAAIMKQIIIGHDWVDFEGRPYPAPDTDEFYNAVSNDQLMTAWAEIQGQQGKSRPRKSGR